MQGSVVSLCLPENVVELMTSFDVSPNVTLLTEASVELIAAAVATKCSEIVQIKTKTELLLDPIFYRFT